MSDHYLIGKAIEELNLFKLDGAKRHIFIAAKVLLLYVIFYTKETDS